MMIKKLSQDEVMLRVSDIGDRLHFGISLGLVKSSGGVDDPFVSDCIYDRLVDVPRIYIQPWVDLFICRAYDQYSERGGNIFEQIAEVYEAFGCPDYVKDLVYFEPSFDESPSEHFLVSRIASYVLQAKLRLRGWSYGDRDTNSDHD